MISHLRMRCLIDAANFDELLSNILFFPFEAYHPHTIIGEIRDANFLLGGSMYSKLFLYRNLKIRPYVNLSYTKQLNRIELDPLDIHNPFAFVIPE
jgi:hypothetical protein